MYYWGFSFSPKPPYFTAILSVIISPKICLPKTRFHGINTADKLQVPNNLFLKGSLMSAAGSSPAPTPSPAPPAPTAPPPSAPTPPPYVPTSAWETIQKFVLGNLAAVIYGIIFLGCVIYRLGDHETYVGVLLTCALLEYIPLVFAVYFSGLIADTAADAKPSKRQIQARIMVLHSIAWIALIVLPLHYSLVLSGILLLLIVTLVFVSIAYKDKKKTEEDMVKQLTDLDNWLQPLIVIIIALLFCVAGYISYNVETHARVIAKDTGNVEFISAFDDGTIPEYFVKKYKGWTASDLTSNKEAEKRRLEEAASRRLADASSTSDRLAGTQSIQLCDTPAPAVTPTNEETHPDFTANIDGWSQPVNFIRGRTEGLSLSRGSYINVTTPSDAAQVTFLAEPRGAGVNITLDNGVCALEGSEYAVRGSWHQGSNTGAYVMQVRDTGATVWMYDGNTSREVCRIIIFHR